MADPRVLEGIKKYINNRQRQILVRKAQKEMESEQELNTLLRQTVQTKDGRPQLPAIPTPEEAANLDFPSQEEMGMTDNEYRQFMFEQGVYKDSEGWKQLPADVNIQRRRIYEGEDIPDPNSMYNESGERPAGLLQASAPQENVETKGKTIDTIQSTLDAAGMLSGPLEPVGIGADALNTLISLGRGNVSDAAISAASIIPIVGLFSKPIKKIRARVKFDEKGRIIKDREYTKAMNDLEKEVLDNIEGVRLEDFTKSATRQHPYDKRIYTETAEGQAYLDVYGQAKSLLKRIRNSNWMNDIQNLFDKFRD
jgi:hypothetical protein